MLPINYNSYTPMFLFAGTEMDKTLQQSSGILRHILDMFNAHSLLVLACALLIAVALGRLLATGLRRATTTIGNQADKVEDLATVNRLRRFETLIVLSIAIVRTLLILMAIYFWWSYIHPFHQPTAIIGASAIFAILLGGVLGPVLRDFAYGSVMMAEHWFGVGDHIRVEPFADMQGVVERVTLRSTRIRGLNGEVIWINNQNIGGVRIAPRGIRTIALEIFVSSKAYAHQLIQQANLRLPTGPLMVVSPLTIMTETEATKNLWHITAIGETAPGREWLIEKYAIQIIQELAQGEQNQQLVHEPIARYADSEAERKFARTIHNARKTRAKRRLNTKRKQNKKP